MLDREELLKRLHTRDENRKNNTLKWTKEEDEVAADSSLRVDEKAIKLNRSTRSVRDRCLKMGYRNASSNWSEDEDNVLRTSTDVPDKHLAEVIGRTVYAVKTRRRDLGIKKDK